MLVLNDIKMFLSHHYIVVIIITILLSYRYYYIELPKPLKE